MQLSKGTSHFPVRQLPVRPHAHSVSLHNYASQSLYNNVRFCRESRGFASTGFEPDGAGASIMTIEHELLPPALVRCHAHGWTAISAQLESRLRSTESRSPDPGSRTRTLTAPH